jgi:hypothetical protein
VIAAARECKTVKDIIYFDELSREKLEVCASESRIAIPFADCAPPGCHIALL